MVLYVNPHLMYQCHLLKIETDIGLILHTVMETGLESRRFEVEDDSRMNDCVYSVR